MPLIDYKNKSRYLPLGIMIFAGLFVFAVFSWQGNMGFSLWDEGYLWYGAQRVMQGEVPVRDFMSYDPGRYYWSAAFMGLWGDDGIMSLRVAVAIFQALGLFVALMLIAHASKARPWFLLLSAVVLIGWMFPRHKLFDISLAIFLCGVLTYLTHKRTISAHLIAGVCVGLIAVFGRNHGVYGAVASIGLLIWLSIGQNDGVGLARRMGFWSLGVIVGFSPVLIMALIVPGFAAAFWQSVQFLFEIQATNLPLPVPWPWRLNLAAQPLAQSIRAVMVGFFFMATLAFGVISLLWIFIQKYRSLPVPPALVAASFLALPYAHYAYSRADVGHLAQGIFPLLIGCLVYLGRQSSGIRWLAGGFLCVASLSIVQEFHPAWQCHVSRSCESIEISGNSLMVDKATAKDVTLLRELTARYAAKGQNFIAAPFWPGAYPLMKRKAPMWEIYALFPRPPVFEHEEIRRIRDAAPGFAIIFDYALDGRDELRFRHTHPLTHQYIAANFERVPDSPNPRYQIYKAKTPVQ